MKKFVSAVLFFAATLCFASVDIVTPIDRDEAIAAAQKVTTERYPDADSVMVDNYTFTAYNADGTYANRNEVYVKVLTERGRRGHMTLSSHYTIPYQQAEDCSIDLVEIIKEDGRTVAIDVSTAKTMIDPSSMKSNIYNPNGKIIKLNIPGLEVGDTLHYSMFDRIVQPRMKDTWCDFNSFESSNPIVRSVLKVSSPAELPLKSQALLDEVEGSVQHSTEKEEQTGRTIHSWTAQNIPRMFPEPDMPPAYTQIQRLLLSTAPDWETVSRWYWNLSKPHFEMTDGIRAKVAELTADAQTDQEKMEALFYFVSQKIRYMGITTEADAPGYEPHDVADTFNARHGVCRDKAALLVVMLREAGLEAFPVLIHAGVKKDPEVPMPYFNHAITSVRKADGEIVLMDPTDENTRQLLPGYLNDRSFLLASPQGDPLRTSPIIPAKENMMHIETIGSIDAEGRMKAETSLKFDGINDNTYRGYFSKITPEERRRFFESIVKSAAPSARLEQLTIRPEDMLDPSQPLEVSLVYSADGLVIEGDAASMLSLPSLGANMGQVNFTLGATGLKERKYPLKTDIACGVRENITLDIAPELQGAVLPDNELEESEALTWRKELAEKDGKLNIVNELQLKLTEFSPEQYAYLKETLQRMERAGRCMPIIPVPAMDADSPDAEWLAIDINYDIQDETHWTQTVTRRLKVLTYAGKKDYSELKIGYNSGLEKVELLSAVSISEDGTKHEISKKEINLMDQGWVGSAPRYPAGKTLVASIPAVEVGSELQWSYKRSVTNAAGFYASSSFRAQTPIAEKTLTITAPLDLDLKIIGLHMDQAPQSTTAANDKVVYTWKVEDVPARPKERYLPPWWTFNPTLIVGTRSWRNYGEMVNDKLESCTKKQYQTAQLGSELTAQIKDPAAKLKAIRDHVATTVRSAGPSFTGLPLWAVTPADFTLKEAYGNSADRAVLLATMLRGAGFDVSFELSGSSEDIPMYRNRLSTFCMPGYFPTVLVRIHDKIPGIDGALYLNDSNQYSALGTSTHENKLAIKLPEGAVQTIAPARPSYGESSYKISLNEEGTATIEVKNVLRGTSFGGTNKSYTEMSPEELRRHYQELVAGVSQSAEPVGDLMTDFSTYPGIVSFNVRIPDFAIRTGAYFYCPVFGMPSRVFSRLADRRDAPLYQGSTSLSKSQTSICFPDGYEVVSRPADRSAPAALENIIEIDTRGTETGNSLTLDTRIMRSAGTLPAKAYPQLLDYQGQLRNRGNRMLLLQKTDSDQ